MNERME
jgi:hypothetical protein